ncbi:DUF3857 domain-containing protein [Paraburkholderia phenazinium]|uniref:Transglutaminase-like superfamily protein n=1 Tax=Paraburkholderia phenazinium TaxID=60549 RepID=A0A1G7SKP4_9BURK|nr:DUF3857 domain-containing protein [Paraburkholderia phenazinium]SDG23472.1 Transglutaminase-like superfamily protein [Paraburkholderia phenazinium]
MKIKISSNICRWAISIPAMLVVATHSAAAIAGDFRPNTTVLNDDNVYNVKADGTYTLDEVVSYRIETDQGVQQRSQIPLYYSPSLERLDILDAYTTTRNGKRIDVTPDKILLQQSAESAGAPTFDDGKVKTVVFPDVQTGATLTLHTLRTQKKALFPGQFASSDNFLDNRVFKSASVTVHVPAALKLHADAIDMQGGLVSSSDSGEQTWRWTIKDTSAHAPEFGAPDLVDHSPRVVTSTFPSFDAVGSAYLERATPQASVTPAIQALSDQITAGLTDRRTQAEALYRWVSTNIRYVAIYLGFGGVVPHSAQAIMDARYGDCKDHVTLLQALLAAKGIVSSPVLVNAESRYSLPAAAAPLAAFDHVITYLPEFKLYADSTAGVARFGTLPITEQGKPALVADDGSGHAALVSLPLSNPATDHLAVQVRVTLDSDGSVKGNAALKTSGIFDWMSRVIFSSLPPGTESQFAAKLLSFSGQNGEGNFTHGNVHDLTQPFDYSTQFDLPSYAQLPGPGAIRMPQGTANVIDIAGAFDAFGPATREFPLVFLGRHISESIELDLPDGLKVASLPKPVQIASSFGSYASSYSQTGNVITLTRSLDITVSSPVVEPKDYPELRKMALAIKRDSLAQIVY